MSDDTITIHVTTADQRAHAFAMQLAEWSNEFITSTAYLRDGSKITTSRWNYNTDGLLMFDGDAGDDQHLLDPGQIIAVHVGEAADRNPCYDR